jgi:pSer/pThr/pTyr-binding forkhead associated (FHA) protein
VQAALVHVRSDGHQQNVPLRSGKVLVGRQEDCQIRIPSAQVSRHHCEITSGADGLRIRDLGSSNGTTVNGQRVDEAHLRPGDVVAVGPMLFVVRIDGEPAQIDPEALTARVAASSAAPARQPAPGTLGGKDDSSVDLDFDFDLSDEDDDQPAL